MKRPSFQFYVGDWQSNSNLRRCTFAEKGIWLDVMCLMHDGEDYGLLRWPLKEIAQAVGCKVSDLAALAAKGVLKGADAGQTCAGHVYTPRHAGKEGEPVVLIADEQGPIWFSSRMVDDEYVRNSRGKGTRFGEDKPPKKTEDGSPPTRRVGERQGEESSQREGDGPSVFNLQSSPSGSKKEILDRAVPEDAAPPDPIITVIRTFDDARAEVFGQELRRPFAAADDRVFAERFLATGATLEWLKAFFLERIAKRKKSGQDAPDGLKYFEKAVPEALQRIAGVRGTPQPNVFQPKSPPIQRTPDEQAQYDADQRRWHLKMGIQHPTYNPEGIREKEACG